MSDDSCVEATTSRDKRALELEELRKKQLAKSIQGSLVDNGKGDMKTSQWSFVIFWD